MAYAVFNDCERFFENFGTGYYGTYLNDGTLGTLFTSQWQDDINSSFDRVNILLESIERVPSVPIGTNPVTGSYHPYLKEWNACDTIFTKLKSRHAVEYNNNFPQWILSFGSRCQQILDDIYSGKVTFDTDTTSRGIGYPKVITKTSVAGFYSNWDSGFYSQCEYPKTYHFKITSVTAGTTIGLAQFQISYDGGYSWSSSLYNTGTNWINIEKGLAIRWEMIGTTTGTQVEIALNDEYEIVCVPANVGKTNAKVHTMEFGRG